MNKKIQLAVRTAITGVALTCFAGPSYAGTVDSAMRSFDSGTTSLVAGGTLTATNQTSTAHSYTGNPGLNYSAWGHAGRWYNFEVDSTVDTTINVTANNTANLSPAFTVYRTDGQWGGGTAQSLETGITGNTPHNFNGTGNIGDDGTIWMMQGGSISAFNLLTGLEETNNNSADSNAIATIAYANSGPTHDTTETNWGEDIHNGAHAKDGALTYTSGVSGSVGTGMAEITLADLATGWYTVYVGGADAAKLNAAFSVTVSAVPVPAAVYLFGSSLIGLLATRRKPSTTT